MGIGSSAVAPDVPDRNYNKRKQHHGENGWCSCFDRKQSVEFGDRRLTKEEAKECLGNFDSMMGSEMGRKVFQEFLQSQYSDENLKFWLAAERYREQSLDVRKTLGRTVYEDYISTISPCEVSIDAKLRSEIEENLDNASVSGDFHYKAALHTVHKRIPKYARSKCCGGIFTP